MSDLLAVNHLTMRFGGLTAIDDVSFAAKNKEITAIIGPNGAGKTTVFNCLTGFYKPTVGELLLQGDSLIYRLERLEDFVVAQKARVARTFQNIRLFPAMSVLENLLVAQHNKLMLASGWTIKGLFGLSSYKKEEAQAIELAKYWLDKTNLMKRANDNASDLPYGDQRRLEIARGMCTDPRMLCLDEPAAGMNPKESAELNSLLQFIRDEHKIGVLLIEHDMSVVMEISDHIIVLDYGRKIAEGSPKQVRSDPAVIRAYLGEDEDEELPPEVTADLQSDKAHG